MTSVEIESCVDCPHHSIVPNPDPYGWFRDDVVVLKCEKTGKIINEACRPYNLRKEATVPDWCPIRSNGK